MRVDTHTIIATDVSLDEFHARYDGFYEWVRGAIIQMAPVSMRHDQLTAYLRVLLATYLQLNPVGVVHSAPFPMRLLDGETQREPDLQLILNPNRARLTDTYMNGPADVAIEVVSPESVQRDHGEKFAEYEAAGVGEYWIVDPLRDEARFYRLDEDGVYIPQGTDSGSYYTTPALPRFRLYVPTLWQTELPTTMDVVGAVRAMLGDTDPPT